MRSYHRAHVKLGKKDRRQVTEMLRKGQEPARVLRRASILRQLDDGQKMGRVAENEDAVHSRQGAIAESDRVSAGRDAHQPV